MVKSLEMFGTAVGMASGNNRITPGQTRVLARDAISPEHPNVNCRNLDERSNTNPNGYSFGNTHIKSFRHNLVNCEVQMVPRDHEC